MNAIDELPLLTPKQATHLKQTVALELAASKRTIIRLKEMRRYLQDKTHLNDIHVLESIEQILNFVSGNEYAAEITLKELNKKFS